MRSRLAFILAMTGNVMDDGGREPFLIALRDVSLPLVTHDGDPPARVHHCICSRATHLQTQSDNWRNTAWDWREGGWEWGGKEGEHSSQTDVEGWTAAKRCPIIPQWSRRLNTSEVGRVSETLQTKQNKTKP